MYLGEAESKVDKIKLLGCAGKPLAVSDKSDKEMVRQFMGWDQGVIVCRENRASLCIFCGGKQCLSNFKGDELKSSEG